MARRGDATATSDCATGGLSKVDGYGVQSALTAKSQKGPFSRPFGEYCTATKTGVQVLLFPRRRGPHRARAVALVLTTALALGHDRERRNAVASPVTRFAAGVTDYTLPRIARQRTGTTVGAAGTVTGINVDGVQTFPLRPAARRLAGCDRHAAKINACTLAMTGACATVGFQCHECIQRCDRHRRQRQQMTLVVTGGTTTPPVAFSAATSG